MGLAETFYNRKKRWKLGVTHGMARIGKTVRGQVEEWGCW